MYLAVIKQTLREAVLQPALLFAIIIEVAFLGLVGFGVSFHFEQGTLVSAELLGKVIDETIAAVFIRDLAVSVTNILTGLLMFLFIVGSSFVFPSMLRDPLLGITLTKPITRTSLFLSKFSAFLLLVFTTTILFAAAVSLALFLRSDGHISGSLIPSSLFFCCEFVVVFAFCSFLALIVENPMGVALLGTAFYFLLGPLLAGGHIGRSSLITIVSLFFPPIGKLSLATKEILLASGPAEFTLLVYSLLYVIVLLTLAAVIFSRRELT